MSPRDDRGSSSAQKAVSALKPLKQGEFGTCCSYAFASGVCSSLLVKYGVALDAEIIAAFLSPKCWDGAVAKDLYEKWNKELSQQSFPDVDKKKRYKLRISPVTQIDELQSAASRMRQSGDTACMVAVISTEVTGHSFHAVWVYRSLPSKLIAVNSWGAATPLMLVDDKNFQHALMFEPELTECMEKQSQEVPLPQITAAWRGLQEQAMARTLHQGLTGLNRKYYTKAEGLLERVVSIQPDWAVPKMRLYHAHALNKEEAGDLPGALEDIREARRLCPDGKRKTRKKVETRVLNNLGLRAFDREDFFEAEGRFKEASTLVPQEKL